jgi:hypothetical protein
LEIRIFDKEQTMKRRLSYIAISILSIVTLLMCSETSAQVSLPPPSFQEMAGERFNNGPYNTFSSSPSGGGIYSFISATAGYSAGTDTVVSAGIIETGVLGFNQAAYPYPNPYAQAIATTYFYVAGPAGTVTLDLLAPMTGGEAGGPPGPSGGYGESLQLSTPLTDSILVELSSVSGYSYSQVNGVLGFLSTSGEYTFTAPTNTLMEINAFASVTISDFGVGTTDVSDSIDPSVTLDQSVLDPTNYSIITDLPAATAVPEPTTLTLLLWGSGLAGLAALRKKYRTA